MPEEWEVRFNASLIARAHIAAAEVKEADPKAQARADFYPALLDLGLYCPECWVRFDQTARLHRARWIMTCDQHDYHFP